MKYHVSGKRLKDNKLVSTITKAKNSDVALKQVEKRQGKMYLKSTHPWSKKSEADYRKSKRK